MAWCPKCKSEYIDGIKTCAKCGVELTDEPQGQKETKKHNKTIADTYYEKLFLNTNNVIKLNYIVSMLDVMDISYRVQEMDVGQYLSIIHGRSFYGSSIFVDQSKLEDAKEILRSFEAEFLVQKDEQYLLENVKNIASWTFLDKISLSGKPLRIFLWFILILRLLLGTF